MKFFGFLLALQAGAILNAPEIRVDKDTVELFGIEQNTASIRLLFTSQEKYERFLIQRQNKLIIKHMANAHPIPIIKADTKTQADAPPAKHVVIITSTNSTQTESEDSPRSSELRECKTSPESTPRTHLPPVQQSSEQLKMELFNEQPTHSTTSSALIMESHALENTSPPNTPRALHQARDNEFPQALRNSMNTLRTDEVSRTLKILQSSSHTPNAATDWQQVVDMYGISQKPPYEETMPIAQLTFADLAKYCSATEIRRRGMSIYCNPHYIVYRLRHDVQSNEIIGYDRSTGEPIVVAQAPEIYDTTLEYFTNQDEARDSRLIKFKEAVQALALPHIADVNILPLCSSLGYNPADLTIMTQNLCKLNSYYNLTAAIEGAIPTDSIHLADSEIRSGRGLLDRTTIETFMKYCNAHSFFCHALAFQLIETHSIETEEFDNLMEQVVLMLRTTSLMVTTISTGGHYITLAISNTGHVTLIDSMSTKYAHVVKQIVYSLNEQRRIFAPTLPEFQEEAIALKLQHDGTSCGVHSIVNSCVLARVGHNDAEAINILRNLPSTRPTLKTILGLEDRTHPTSGDYFNVHCRKELMNWLTELRSAR